MDQICKLVLGGLLVVVSMESSLARVLELDDRFREARKSGEWLVMFYAPWCGHCRQLEPTWVEIGNAMEGHVVNVARLDCTKYSSLSGEFGVRGFPTIKVFSGENQYEYRGARTKQDIMGFVEKARGPKMHDLDNAELIKAAQRKHVVFFLYVGDPGTDLHKSFEKVAGKLFLTLTFYAAPSEAFPTVKAPTVLTFKDDTHYPIPFSSEKANPDRLSLWVMSEQIPDFSELTGISYHTLKGTGKLFAVAVIDEDKPGTLRSIAKDLALSRSDLFHPKYVFCWVSGNGIINRMTYTTISTPNFVVFNPQNYEYYVLNSGEASSEFSENKIRTFLTDVKNGKLPALGGSGFIQQVKRFFSDSTSMVINFFRDTPIMASLVIGVPTFVITFLCYCICTMDDSADEEMVTDSEGEDEDIEGDSERLPEYQEEETSTRQRNIDQEEGSGTSEGPSGDAPLETDKDK